MIQDISLEQYLKLGGKLEKVDWKNSYSDYSGDKNYKARVVSYSDSGDFGGGGTPLYYFTFDNGNTHRYAISWIKIKVEFVLSDIYK